MKKAVNILAIESSCDETSSAVIHNGNVLSNIIATQQIHHKYGGVVPELASRDHERSIIPVVAEALLKANIGKNELSAVAFTEGPGLLGSLLVGTSFAKSFAASLEVPIIGVNHMQAHILAHFIDPPCPNFPFLCLTVSGGHTQIVLVEDFLKMSVIGQTLDDAAGEAFDKVAKIMGLPYPGGPVLDKLASTGNASAYPFPVVTVEGYDYSFSGIKTNFLYFFQKMQKEYPDFPEGKLEDVCASIQDTLVKILLKKLVKASEDLLIKEIAIAGGVAANSGLRQQLKALEQQYGWRVFMPAFQYCTDNAAMIGITAYHKFLQNQFSGQDVAPSARLIL